MDDAFLKTITFPVTLHLFSDTMSRDTGHKLGLMRLLQTPKTASNFVQIFDVEKWPLHTPNQRQINCTLRTVMQFLAMDRPTKMVYSLYAPML